MSISRNEDFLATVLGKAELWEVSQTLWGISSLASTTCPLQRKSGCENEWSLARPLSYFLKPLSWASSSIYGQL